jgi:hypothetical protein
LYEIISSITVPLFGLKKLKIIEKFPVLSSIISALISLIDNSGGIASLSASWLKILASVNFILSIPNFEILPVRKVEFRNVK